jgi:hypothetical protein
MKEALVRGASDRVAHSRIINGGIQRIKLIIGANLGFEIMLFIVAHSVITSTYSLKIPIPVSVKVHRTKLNLSARHSW